MVKLIMNDTLWAILLLTCCCFLEAHAGEGPRPHHEKMHKAFLACEQELGIPAPAEGQHPQLTDEQKEKMHACLKKNGVTPPKFAGGKHTKFHQAMKACLNAAGVKPPEHAKGERPVLDAATKVAMERCRQEVKNEEGR